MEKWKSGKITGWRGKNKGLSAHIRRYLFKKYNSKCVKCSWSEIHEITKRIPLQVNHINGIFYDNREINLELLCPNCHSLTPTFGSLNKNGRRTQGCM